jgi:hypothetical protein
MLKPLASDVQGGAIEVAVAYWHFGGTRDEADADLGHAVWQRLPTSVVRQRPFCRDSRTLPIGKWVAAIEA